MTEMTWVNAITAALREEMTRDERVFIIGEDVIYNHRGDMPDFVEQFGLDRVRNTPISEAGFIGAAAGAAMVGMRPVIDCMIAPFLYVAFDQVVSIISKSTYLYGGQASLPLTIRAPMYFGRNTAAQHSDRPLSTFMTIPGLKIVAPSCPRDLKGLLKAAIREDDPVICFEDNRLRLERQDVPEGDDVIPLGVADIKRSGKDVTVVAISGTVKAALTAAGSLEQDGISAEVIDPRSLVPLDSAAILESVQKTHRLVVVDPSHEVCSVASEISALVAEEAFWSLEAPIARVTTPHIHIPFSPPLEADIYPTADRISAAVRKTVA
jgi:pyruvate/2-oxoglutarate/acetoin dehydrogenase E1 component